MTSPELRELQRIWGRITTAVSRCFDYLDQKPPSIPAPKQLAAGGLMKTEDAFGLLGAPMDCVTFDFDAGKFVPIIPLPSRPSIADRIHEQRHYQQAHPATPDTFWAGMRHAEAIARGEI